MSKGNRGSGFAVVTALTALLIAGFAGATIFHLGWKNGNAKGEYAANSSAYASHAQSQIEECFTLLDDISKAVCVRDVVETQNEHERAESDLVAQTEMGLWALGMLIVTAIMAVVTGFGVYFVWRTLKATQEMAIDTREIGEAQVRAYLAFKIKDVEIIPPTILIKDGEWSNLPATVTISGELHNSGQSPARRMKCRYDIQSVPKDSTIEVDARKLAATVPPSAQIIASGECTNQVFRRRLPVNWAALLAGNEHIWFMFALSYDDAFGNTINEPASAGHIDGVSKLVARDAGIQAEQPDSLRFIWNQIESETTYHYDDGE